MRDAILTVPARRTRCVCGRARKPDGFTLIEVLVALVVVAVSVTAVLHSASVASRTAQGLEERFFARQVALEEITLLRLGRDYPAIGIRTGQRRMASRTWNWEARITQTAEPRMRRVEVSVSNDRHELVTVAAYVSERTGGRDGE